MIGWFISLALIVIFTIGSWIPGSVDNTLTRALQERLGSRATAQVHVDGDPLLQLPFGYIPLLEAKLTGFSVMEVPVKLVTMHLTELHIDPAAALIGHRAVLTAPTDAWIALDVDASAVQGWVDRQAAAGAFSRINGQVTFFGQKLGGTLNLQDPVVTLDGGRVGLKATAQVLETRAQLPVEASARLVIEEGRRLVLAEPKLLLNGRPLPSFLIAPQLERFNPLVDIGRLNLPQGDWRLLGLDITPAGLTLKIGGQLTALPSN
jgi:hypothetical protein